jgi:ATP-binding protein involved in chromosome partitioning
MREVLVFLLISYISYFSDKGVSMIDDLKNLINKVVSPSSGKLESRVQDVMENNGEILIKYNREGLSPENKNEYENRILVSIKNKISSEKVTFSSFSKDSRDVYKTVNESTKIEEKKTRQDDASLKVGHGEKVKSKRNVPNVGRVIAVASGKGGVGKSTVAVNLALALKEKNKKVGLLDADIYGPSLPMLLNKRGERPRANEQKKILPLDTYGLKLMSFGFFVKEEEPVIWRGPMLGGVLSQFLFDVDWGTLDYLIIDLPPGTGDMQLSMAQTVNVDGAIIVSTPQDVALLDAVKGFNMFKQVKTPVLGMVENMSFFECNKCGEEHFIFGKGGVEASVKKLGTQLLGQIPLDIKVREGSDEGRPFMTLSEHKNGLIWKTYMAIAENVDKIFSEGEKNRKGFLGKLFGK